MRSIRSSGAAGLVAFVSATFVALTIVSAGAGSAGPHRVGYVADAGTIHDGGIGQLMFGGFARGARDFRFDARVMQVPQKGSWVDALTSLGRQRYDLIVSGTFVPAQVAASVAKRFPKSAFLVPDPAYGAVPRPPKNMEELVFKVEEAGYLAGYLAGLMETRAPGPDTVSALGGSPTPPVNRYIAGYAAGARAADPGIKVIVDYANSFADPGKCRRLALSEIARGAGVVFPVAGICGNGALQAAGLRHVWGVGVDVDQSSVGPQILTSVLKRDDVGVYRELRALSEGKLETGQIADLGLAEGAVGLGKISPRVPRAFLRRLSTVARQIADGTVRVPSAIS